MLRLFEVFATTRIVDKVYLTSLNTHTFSSISRTEGIGSLVIVPVLMKATGNTKSFVRPFAEDKKPISYITFVTSSLVLSTISYHSAYEITFTHAVPLSLFCEVFDYFCMML